MKFNLENKPEKDAAFALLTELTAKKKVVDIKRVVPTRTLKQNAYLHLLIGLFGEHFGYLPEEAKQVYKEINSDIYRYEREVRGVTRTYWRTSADITKEQMAKSIDRLMIASASQGFELPAAEDHGFVMYAQNQLEKAHYTQEED